MCFRCLKDLEVPHFHHELVYEAVVMVIESSHEKTEEAMCKLLQSLFRSFVITIEQVRVGFQRCYDQMVDISIDVPQAYLVLERWVLRCRQVRINYITSRCNECIPREWVLCHSQSIFVVTEVPKTNIFPGWHYQ